MGNYIIHSAKGTTWGKHKYIAIRNGRYIYPDDFVDTNKSGETIYRQERGSEYPNFYKKHAKEQAKEWPDRNVTLVESRNLSDSDDDYMYGHNTTRAKAKDVPRIMDDRSYAKKEANQHKGVPTDSYSTFSNFQSKRKAGRDETAEYKRLENYKAPKTAIKDRQFNKHRNLTPYNSYKNNPDARPRNGVVVKNARDEGRKAVQDYKKVQEKKAAINRATKNMERYARDTGRKAAQEYKKAQTKKSASERITSSLRNVKTTAKATVSKGKSAVSGFLSRFKKRG